MFRNKRILVTGGTGSWGYELVTQLLSREPQEIVVYSRSESSQVSMQRAFDDDRLSFVIGDVRDREALTIACEGIDYVFHLAALKHVPVCEEQPYEALKTNVEGTENLIHAAIENNVEKVINVSTDKAANPSNFYGMTKAIGEKLTIHANLLKTNTKFMCVRGGNVLGTNGSVIHLFKKQIREKGQVGITHRDMTRFFLTLEEAIGLLLRATKEGIGGETFVMHMPTCRIIDLAEVLGEAMGVKNVKTIELGIRPGEKIHEILFSEFESVSTYHFDQENYVVLPPLDIPGLKRHYSGYTPVAMGSYSSSENLMNKEQIRQMLVKGGFIS
ncbi:polysaccharide biosynthesis protein [Paenibacillus turpanensis]|uniref:polysaccharide biosynthesis protein n=1 Tax=Paenibacillus turpanensis TaxID=2689078 RepID=UPI0014073F29|nr:polysaccharide biosynthesis protein [Paenibacillus turpanensis]